ncbi:MAG: hypothetical protein IJ489_10290 [Clostridia bacterium]|nr:hypothetical protein [Clostridia bacterium]
MADKKYIGPRRLLKKYRIKIRLEGSDGMRLTLELCTRKDMLDIIRAFLSEEEQEQAIENILSRRKAEKEKELSSWKDAEEYNRKKYEDLKQQMRNASPSEIRTIHDDMVSALKACDYAKMRYQRLLKEIENKK